MQWRGCSLRVLVVALACSSIAVAVPAAGAAPPQWSTPVTAGEAGTIIAPAVVVDAEGVATVAWISRDGATSIVRTSRCTRTACATPVDLTDTTVTVSELDLAIASDGAIVAGWIQRSGAAASIHARSYRTGQWGPDAQVYAVQSPFDLSVAAFADGASVFTFRTIGGAGSTGDVATCSGYLALCSQTQVESGLSVSEIEVGSNGAAAGLLALTTLSGQDRQVSAAPLLLAGGTISVGNTTRTTLAVATTVLGLTVGVDLDGIATVAWSQGADNLMAQRFPVAQVPNASVPPVVASSVDDIRDGSIAIGSDRAGRTVLSWSVTPSAGGAGQVVRSLVYVDGTAQAPTTVLGAALGTTRNPALAVGGDGRVVLAADRGERVITRVRARTASTWTPRTVAPDSGATIQELRAAANADGQTALVWIAVVGTASRIRYSSLEAGDAPRVRFASRRATATQITMRITSNVAGRVSQVGRYRVGSRTILACRARAVRVRANRPRLIRCTLTGRARADRASRNLRITFTTTLRPTGEPPVRQTTRYTLRRRS